MKLYVIVPIISFVGGWLGSFLGAYLKKKGENLATHEDIDKLRESRRWVISCLPTIREEHSSRSVHTAEAG
jgi:hypothetical protein